MFVAFFACTQVQANECHRDNIPDPIVIRIRTFSVIENVEPCPVHH